MSGSFNLTDQTNLFKVNYYKKSENMYNSFNVALGRVKKKYDFTGKSRFINTPLSFSGGVGSGVLPTPNAGTYGDALIYSKKVYATCQIEREAIKASQNNEGAFVQATKESVQKAVESFMRNCSRILFGDGSGLLGQGNAAGANVAGNGSVATPYVIEIPLAKWKEANWEEKDFVQVVTGLSGIDSGTMEATLLEVVLVVPSTRKVSLVGTSTRLAALTGANPLAATDGIAMQGSYGQVANEGQKDPMGLKGIADMSAAGTGSIYNIPVQRRWSMLVEDAGAAGISPDWINKMILGVEKRVGKLPSIVITSYLQFQKVLNFLEDHKTYQLPARAADLKGQISFKGVEIMTSRGPIGLFTDRFVEDDTMYFLNDEAMEVHHRPDFGWFDDDGTVFLRTARADGDNYEARYGGYFQNYFIPTFQGCLRNLAV